MKRSLSLICAFVIALALLMPWFSAAKKNKSNHIAFANVENEYYDSNAIDLISRNPIGNISNGVLENIAPYDTDTNKKMEGYSITPNSDDYGQIKSKSFKA